MCPPRPMSACAKNKGPDASPSRVPRDSVVLILGESHNRCVPGFPMDDYRRRLHVLQRAAFPPAVLAFSFFASTLSSDDRASTDTFGAPAGTRVRTGRPGRRPAPAGVLSVHPRQFRVRLPGQDVDVPAVLGLRHRRGVQPALPLPAGPGRHRAVGGAGSADAVRLRLRRPRVRRGGRQGRCRGRHAGRRRGPVRRDPAGHDQHQLHDQRHRGHPAGVLRGRRREGGGADGRSSPAPSRTTSSRSTPRAGRGSGRQSRHCA